MTGTDLPSKAEMTLEELFISVFCCVTEQFALLYGNPYWVLPRRIDQRPLFCDAQVVTIALVGELQGEDSQKTWHGRVKKNWRFLFPHLCERSRFGRRVRPLRLVMAHLQQQFCFLLGVGTDRYRIVDSMPLSLCHMRRVNSSTRPFEYTASVGYCASKKEHYYGWKIQLLCDLRGIPCYLVATPAHSSDLAGFDALVQDLVDAGLTRLAILVVADKGYVGKDFIEKIKGQHDIELMPIPRHYHKELPVSALSRLLQKSRRQIETTKTPMTQGRHHWSTGRSDELRVDPMSQHRWAYDLIGGQDHRL